MINKYYLYYWQNFCYFIKKINHDIQKNRKGKFRE